MLSSPILIPVCKKKEKSPSKCVSVWSQQWERWSKLHKDKLSSWEIHAASPSRLDDLTISAGVGWTLELLRKKKRTDLWVKLHFQGGLTSSSSRGLNCWSVSYCIIRNRPPNDTVTTIQRKVQIFRYFVRTVTFGAKKQAEDSKNKSYACVFNLMLQDFPMLCLRSG